MAMLIKRGGPHIPGREGVARNESMSPSHEGDDTMEDFGFQEEPYEVDEHDEPPPYEPDDEDLLSEVPVPASAPAKKPLKKPLVRAALVEDTPRAAVTGEPARSAMKDPGTKKIQLSCHLSFDHHRRLRVHCIMTGQTVLSIVEGWIEEHCPPL